MRSPVLPMLMVLALPAHADDPAEPFVLGQIVVTARTAEPLALGGSSVGQEAIRTFNRPTLGDAAALIPGVSASTTGGARNEGVIFVRGFDRFQVPLSIDGIRVYLPADNRLDLARFLTFDIAEIQVAKGYASVLDGPGALGGAINLVTTRPAKALEAEAHGALTLGRRADYSSYDAFGRIGTRRDRWYAQASGTRRDRDHFTLSSRFRPTAVEDGGARALSGSTDWRVNLKAGWTPRDGDDYALSFTRQEGSKNAPLSVSDPVALQRNWKWPYWNAESVYFLSTTRLGETATLKTRAYLNRFDNLLQGFDDATQTTQSRPRAFDSYYADRSAGGSAELSVRPLPGDTLSVALHYRRDEHREYQTLFSPARFTEPVQISIEDVWSAAIENRLERGALTLRTGFSYDWRDLRRAEDFTGTSATPGVLIQYRLRDGDAINWQARLGWQVVGASELHASVSRRARFPTLFNRFSTAFNGARSNPDLRPERATNYELGGNTRLGALRIEAAAFYSDLTDLITTLPTQAFTSSNVASAQYYGAELSVSARLLAGLEAGGNYTHVERDFVDPSGVVPALTGVPRDKAFVWARWRPATAVEVVPSLDFASSRVTANTAGTLFFRTGAYANAALRLAWRPRAGVELGLSARNLLDQSIALADGFPEEGRAFTASASVRY